MFRILRRSFLYSLLALWVFAACNQDRKQKTQVIGEAKQDSLFQDLSLLIGNSITTNGTLNDSLQFLVVPIDAACHVCRDKTIDSIYKNLHDLGVHRYVIISGTDWKTIEQYFDSRKLEFPQSPNIAFDTINQALVRNLVFTYPTFYKAFNRKVYQKIVANPRTIRRDLLVFFGHDNLH